MSYTHVGLPKLVVGLGTHVGSVIAVRALERLLPLVFYPKHCCCAMAVLALRMPSATGVLGSMLGSRPTNSAFGTRKVSARRRWAGGGRAVGGVAARSSPSACGMSVHYAHAEWHYGHWEVPARERAQPRGSSERG